MQARPQLPLLLGLARGHLSGSVFAQTNAATLKGEPTNATEAAQPKAQADAALEAERQALK